jgi:hypothetical protein
MRVLFSVYCLQLNIVCVFDGFCTNCIQNMSSLLKICPPSPSSSRAMDRMSLLPCLHLAHALLLLSLVACCCVRQVVCKPSSTKVYQEFEGEVYALTKEEGGRHTPFTNNYRPQFYFRTADITGEPGHTGCATLPTVQVLQAFSAACWPASRQQQRQL